VLIATENFPAPAINGSPDYGGKGLKELIELQIAAKGEEKGRIAITTQTHHNRTAENSIQNPTPSKKKKRGQRTKKKKESAVLS